MVLSEYRKYFPDINIPNKNFEKHLDKIDIYLFYNNKLEDFSILAKIFSKKEVILIISQLIDFAGNMENVSIEIRIAFKSYKFFTFKGENLVKISYSHHL